MAHTNTNGWRLATILSLAVAMGIHLWAAGQTPPIEVQISNPGKTGLVPGRYRVEIKPGDAAKKGHGDQIELISVSMPAARHRYDARMTGCGTAAVETMAWAPGIAARPNGTLQLQLASTSARGCRIVATIPAAPVPGIEGTPIGTAGAPAQKAPGIEGSPIGTAGAPKKPGISGARTGGADREIEHVIDKARQAVPRLACPGAPPDIQAQLESLQSSLRQVAAASSAAAAVQPLRRFDAARQALYKRMTADRTLAAGTRRCGDAERRCAASGSVGSGCGIDAAVCLARVACAGQN